jgi:hypothetical protein
MRIRIKHTPAVSQMSATLLQRFEPGLQYEVEDSLGLVFLSEGWAEMVDSKEPALVIPLRKLFLTSVDAAIAADVAFDDAIAAAILRLARQHE